MNSLIGPSTMLRATLSGLLLGILSSITLGQTTAGGTSYIDARGAFSYDPFSGRPFPTGTPFSPLGNAGTWTQCPSSLVIYVHGFNTSPSAAENGFDLTRQNLTAAGFTGAFLGFSWPSIPPASGLLPSSTEFRGGERMANLVGEQALSRSISQLWRRWPRMPIFVLSHSLGARVVLKAFATLSKHHESYAAMNCVARADFLGAAVHDSVFTPEKGEFAEAATGYTPDPEPGTTPGGGSTGSTPIKVWVNPMDPVLRDLFTASTMDPGGGDPFLRVAALLLSIFFQPPNALGYVGAHPRPTYVDQCPGIGKISRSGQDPFDHASYIRSVSLLKAIVAGWNTLL